MSVAKCLAVMKRVGKVLLPGFVQEIIAAFKEGYAPQPPPEPVRQQVKRLPAPTNGKTKGHGELPAIASGQWRPTNGRTLPVREQAPGSVKLGVDQTTGQDVAITRQQRLQIISIFGAPGAGKSALLQNIALASICHGDGLCFIDPHGDTVRAIISGMPEGRLKDVILLDLDADAPVGLNLFETQQPQTLRNKATAASFLSHVFSKVWGLGTETPRLLMVLRAITRTLIDNPGATMVEAGLLFSSDTARAKMVANLTNQEIVTFWEGYNRLSQREKHDLTASCANKIAAFVDEPMIRHIVGQSVSTLDFRRILDEGKILLISLSPQLEEASNLLSAVIIGRLLMAAFSRADVPPEKRRVFHLIADEWHRYATSDFATILSEARKFSLTTTLATQTLESLDDLNRATALQGGSLATFRVSGLDSAVLAKSYNCTPGLEVVGQEPQRAPVANILGHLVQRGHTDEAVTKFAHEYLASLEKYAMTKMADRPYATYNSPTGALFLEDLDVQRGRKLLNDCLYRCMSEKRGDIPIAPLALYVLTVAQCNTMDYVFSPYVRSQTKELFGDRYLAGFAPGMAAFGTSDFLTGGADAFVQQQRRKHRWMAERIVRMLRELRHCMGVLAQSPVLVDTGQYVPQYRQRSYQDQENMIANEISQLPNYTAKVRLLTGEHVIKTNPPPTLLPESKVDARIVRIKQHMLALGITRNYKEIEEQIAKRHEALLRRSDTDKPPPTQSNGRRHPRRLSSRVAHDKPPPTHT